MQKMRNLRVYYIGTLVLTLVSTVLRVLTLSLSLDKENGYFKSTANLPVAFAALLAVAVAAILLYPFLLRDTVPAADKRTDPFKNLCSAFCALCFLIAFVSTCMARKTVALPILLWLIGILAPLAATIYFLAKTPFCPLDTTGQAVFGSLTLIAVGCLIAVTYFDIATPMNAPTKVHLHLALLAVMLYLLYELRDTVGSPLPRARVVLTALTFFLCATVGISDLIANHSEGFIYLSHDFLLLGLSLYTAAQGISDLKALSHTERNTIRQ